MALAGLEQSGRTARGVREPFAVGEAVAEMVKFRPEKAKPNKKWVEPYHQGLAEFAAKIKPRQKKPA